MGGTFALGVAVTACGFLWSAEVVIPAATGTGTLASRFVWHAFSSPTQIMQQDSVRQVLVNKAGSEANEPTKW